MPVAQHSQTTKNKIKKSIKETRARHANMRCITRVVKIDATYLRTHHKQHEKLARVFLEAKWFKNHILANDMIYSDKPYLLKHVNVKLPNDTYDERNMHVLSSHMKQSVIAGMKDDIKGLHTLKCNGHKVGALKPCNEVRAIKLKQHGNTYTVDVQHNRIRVQNIGWLRVRGLEQLPAHSEFSSAVLVHKADGYYIHITVYYKDAPQRTYIQGTHVGIDMGLKTSITLSNGEKFNMYVEEPDRLRRLRKKLSRQTKGSNNYVKTLHEIRKIEQHLTNTKNDIANKFVSDLSHFEHVYFQDEMLSAWKRKTCYVRAGRKIQYGVLGRIKARLRTKQWATMIGKHHATTQTCICGAKNKHQLDERVYFCSQCGYRDDRDVHAAKNMVSFTASDKRYVIQPPQGLGIAPVEHGTSAIHFNFIEGAMDGKCNVKKQETGQSLVDQ